MLFGRPGKSKTFLKFFGCSCRYQHCKGYLGPEKGFRGHTIYSGSKSGNEGMDAFAYGSFLRNSVNATF